MPAVLNDTPSLENVDAVRMGNRAKPVCNGNRGPSRRRFVEGALDDGFGFGVQR
jgi:hypothetical protein